MFERDFVKTIAERMNEPRKFIQVLIGPRQTGKTTAVRQSLLRIEKQHLYVQASIDSASRDWLRAQWQAARNIAMQAGSAVLVVDEIQIVDSWSAVVKELWDEDSWNGVELSVVLTGSSTLLIRSGLAEALTGRYEVVRCTHWSFAECEEAFGYDLDGYLLHGGYPGGAALLPDEQRWLDYMNDAVIEPSIARDVIALDNVRKPALMRRLFYLGAPYSAQEISLRKLMGQLDDAGNATTIAHYLDLLGQAGLVRGLQKFDPKEIRSRASSPRLIAYDTGLMSATFGRYRGNLLDDPALRGRLVETAVGAHLLARSQVEHFDLFWWRDGNDEVDFVAVQGDGVVAIEVKSGRVKKLGGLVAFQNRFPTARTLVVGSASCLLDDFLRGEVRVFE